MASKNNSTKEKSKISTKFVRFVAVLAILVSVVGNTGVARADHGAPPSVSAQKLEPPRAPESQPLDSLTLNIPPASSLGVQFVHVATAANSVWDTTLIDNPLTNGNPNAIILVTPNWNPGNVVGTPDDRPIGVFYNGTRAQWGIYNEDGAAMPPGAAFNVIIPTAGAFVHTATAGNKNGSHTFIYNALTNFNPNVILLVTPNRNPGGGSSGTNANFPIGVDYNNSGNDWAIFSQDGSLMPLNASFNVFALTAGAGVFVQTATSVNMGGGATIIDNPLTNGHPNAIVFVTPNLTPNGVLGTLDNHPIAAFYDGSQWAIINQGITDVPVGASFNVLVLVPRSDIFVHTVTASNKVPFAATYIDNALTNGHPNAIVFTTLNEACNLNLCQLDSHNIGVFYDGNKWRIFNQDGWAMLVGNAFNVLVPNPDTSVFVQKATAANIKGSDTIIDYPLTNGNPNAKILVTPNYGPGGVGGIYDDHPIGVKYEGGQWRIFNQDGYLMLDGAAFNVFVPTAGPGVAVFVHSATAGNSVLDGTFINNALTNGNPNAIILVTPNYTPGGSSAWEDHPIGVVYNHYIRKWAIFNQDGVDMPVDAAFNVYVVPNFKFNLPLVLR